MSDAEVLTHLSKLVYKGLHILISPLPLSLPPPLSFSYLFPFLLPTFTSSSLPFFPSLTSFISSYLHPSLLFIGQIVSIGDPTKRYTKMEKIGQG